jgi:hypothetical protein
MAESAWEAEWQVGFRANSPEELLVALVVRDLLHGSSFDVEHESGNLEVDYLVGDEPGDGLYSLLVTARVEGVEDRQVVQGLTERLLEELVVEAESLVESRRALASIDFGALAFRPVPEHEERWDLVVPDWLAPDGAEVPFGFRPALVETGEWWPSDAELDEYGRIVLVPDSSTARLFAIPAPESHGISPDTGTLPVVQ